MKIKYLKSFSYVDNESVLEPTVKVNRFCIIRGSKIGGLTYIGPSCNFNNVEIGKFCSISKGVNIGLATHPIHHVSTSPIFFSPNNGTGIKWVNEKTFNDSPAKVSIGNDVWIGMNVSINGGVTIGDGAIIGAHALVTKDVEPYTIVGGVPAKVIRKRFDDETIESLLKTNWWLEEDEFLIMNNGLFNKPLDSRILLTLKNKINENSK